MDATVPKRLQFSNPQNFRPPEGGYSQEYEAKRSRRVRWRKAWRTATTLEDKRLIEEKWEAEFPGENIGRTRGVSIAQIKKDIEANPGSALERLRKHRFRKRYRYAGSKKKRAQIVKEWLQLWPDEPIEDIPLRSNADLVDVLVVKEITVPILESFSPLFTVLTEGSGLLYSQQIYRVFTSVKPSPIHRLWWKNLNARAHDKKVHHLI